VIIYGRITPPVRGLVIFALEIVSFTTIDIMLTNVYLIGVPVVKLGNDIGDGAGSRPLFGSPVLAGVPGMGGGGG
jgi:hypothetical protein